MLECWWLLSRCVCAAAASRRLAFSAHCGAGWGADICVVCDIRARLQHGADAHAACNELGQLESFYCHLGQSLLCRLRCHFWMQGAVDAYAAYKELERQLADAKELLRESDGGCWGCGMAWCSPSQPAFAVGAAWHAAG